MFLSIWVGGSVCPRNIIGAEGHLISDQCCKLRVPVPGQGPTIYRHTCTFEGVRAFSVVGRVWSLHLVAGLGGTRPAVPQTKVAIVIPGVRWGGMFPCLTCSRCVTTGICEEPDGEHPDF